MMKLKMMKLKMVKLEVMKLEAMKLIGCEISDLVRGCLALILFLFARKLVCGANAAARVL